MADPFHFGNSDFAPSHDANGDGFGGESGNGGSTDAFGRPSAMASSGADGGSGSAGGGNTDEFGRPTAVASSGSDGGGGNPGNGGPGDTGPGAGGGATAPFSMGLGSGAADGRLVSADAGHGGDLAHVGAIDRGNPHDLTGLTGGHSGNHALTAGVGASGGPTLAEAALLTGADGHSPLSAQIGSGASIADASLFGENTSLQKAAETLQSLGLLGLDGGSSDHSLIASVGAAGSAPLAQAGVLTSPDSHAPVSADVGSGQNLANAGLLPHSDPLSFPSLGGAGTDALTGLVPSVTDLGHVVSTSPATTADQSLVDAHTDGGSIVQVHDNAGSLVGVNDHPLV